MQKNNKAQEPLVSLITYCYNGERFVRHYFDALLAQNYSNIELFFYNNGSNDRTGEIAESYRKQLENKGVVANIIHFKENQCTCALKQKAMQEMHGEYFCGCDSDDIMHPDHISHMVKYLQDNPDKGIVFCKLNIVDEATQRTTGVMEVTPSPKDKSAFIDCIMGRNTIYTAIGYLMRTASLDKVNPTRTIYQSMHGENYQMQLPFLYHDLQGYIDEVLGDYLIRKDSYSVQMHLSGMKRITALKAQETTLIETIKSIKPENMDYYISMAQKRVRRDQYYIAVSIKDKKAIKDTIKSCKEVGAFGSKEILYYFWKILVR